MGALDAVLSLKPNWIGLDRITRTGPKLVTRLLREDGLQHYSPQGVQVNDVFICPKTYFFPFSYDQEFRDDCITPETLAAHFWEKSWAKDVPFPIRWAKSAIQRLRTVHA